MDPVALTYFSGVGVFGTISIGAGLWLVVRHRERIVDEDLGPLATVIFGTFGVVIVPIFWPIALPISAVYAWLKFPEWRAEIARDKHNAEAEEINRTLRFWLSEARSADRTEAERELARSVLRGLVDRADALAATTDKSRFARHAYLEPISLVHQAREVAEGRTNGLV